MRKLLCLLMSVGVVVCALARPVNHPNEPKPGSSGSPIQGSETQSGDAQVRINYLNVCAPAADEQKLIASALARIPVKPVFAADFEVARGRSSMPQAPVARWVRIRHEFGPQSPMLNVEYTFSVDEKGMSETLVFRLRDPAEVMQVWLQDGATTGTPRQLLAIDTPASRIRLERAGKSSVALARCPQTDQSAYQPLFSTASGLLATYRAALQVKNIVPADLARVPDHSSEPKSGSLGSQKGAGAPQSTPRKR